MTNIRDIVSTVRQMDEQQAIAYLDGLYFPDPAAQYKACISGANAIMPVRFHVRDFEIHSCDYECSTKYPIGGNMVCQNWLDVCEAIFASMLCEQYAPRIDRDWLLYPHLAARFANKNKEIASKAETELFIFHRDVLNFILDETKCSKEEFGALVQLGLKAQSCRTTIRNDMKNNIDVSSLLIQEDLKWKDTIKKVKNG